jgi:uncharacterized membrane-anchored protein YitT (DUF2179 family)
MYASSNPVKSLSSQVFLYLALTFGAMLSAFALQVFFVPNKLIDGGITGIAMIFANVFGLKLLPVFLLLFNLPFLYLGYRSIGKTFLMHMIYAVFVLVTSIGVIEHFTTLEFKGETLEIVVIGGALLGIGLGMVIRFGGCLDGTEILGIIINRKTGFTVGQVVLVCNVFVFGAAGFVFQDWHPPLLSLIAYIVVIKVMDGVIVGLDETKSVLIISKKSKAIGDAIIHELGLGLTIMYGRGGFSGDEREILYVIAERLQLADLKDVVLREDPFAFMAIEDLHEVANGKQVDNKKTRMEDLFSRIFSTGK